MENKDASSEEKKEIVEKSQESSKEEAKEETSDKEKQTIEQSAKEVCTLRFGRTFVGKQCKIQLSFLVQIGILHLQKLAGCDFLCGTI